MDDALEIAKNIMNAGSAISAAAKEAAGVTGIKKGDIYKALLAQMK